MGGAGHHACVTGAGSAHCTRYSAAAGAATARDERHQRHSALAHGQYVGFWRK
jgi:hypothetical protein